jgi:predicted metal-dependent hydrolase
MNARPEPPRYLPDTPFPPYSYVPGRHPHPLSDLAGHGHGRDRPPAECPNPEAPFANRPLLHGIDLFNHGYYWEAHEEWEALWHACQRQGPLADFLKGLIKLAAAGVKLRENRPAGVRRHAARAEQLFEASLAAARAGRYCGLDVNRLIEACRQLADPAAADSDRLSIVLELAAPPDD